MNVRLLLFLGMLVQVLSAQERTLYLHQLTSEEGLSQSLNHYAFVDSKGYVWISSLDGVNRFNGHTIETFKRDSNRLVKGRNIQSTFFETSDAHIYFATDAAINVYQHDIDQFQHFNFNGSTKSSIHHLFHVDQAEQLWGTSNNLLYQYARSSAECSTNLISQNFTSPICAVGSSASKKVEVLYVYGLSSGIELIELDSGRIHASNIYFDAENSPIPYFFFDVFAEANFPKRVWLLSDQGLAYCNFEATIPQLTLFQPPIEGAIIKSILPANEQFLWVLTAEPSRLWLFDQQKKQFFQQPFHLFNVDQKKTVDKVDRILAVQDSILWLSTYGGGVYYTHIGSQRFTALFQQQAIAVDNVTQLIPNGEGGVSIITEQDGRWEYTTRNNALTFTELAPFSKQIHTNSSDTTWYLNRITGLSYSLSDTDRFGAIRPQIPIGDIFDAIEWSDRWLLVGTSTGVFWFDKQTKLYQTSSIQEWVIDLFVDRKKQLWLATPTGELKMHKIDSDLSVLFIKSFPNLGMIHQLVEDNIRQGIWIATSEGLLFVDYATQQKHNYSTPIELSNQSITAMALDYQNRLWLGSNQGIFFFHPEEKDEAKRLKNYTARDGLSSDEYIPAAVCSTPDGKIWFGSTKGVDVFHPDDVYPIGKAPKLAISGLKIHDNYWKDSLSINAIEQLRLSYKQNTLTFELAAMEYTDPLRNQFQVYLSYENKTDTISLGTKNSITYANLPPGDYRFAFTACNAEGIWQKTPAELQFLIVPHFSQTSWFKAMITLLILGFVSFLSAFYYRYQLRVKELALVKTEKEKLQLERNLAIVHERVRIAEDMHDQLGSGLTSIQNISVRAARKNKIDHQKGALERVAGLAAILKKNMRAFIWAMSEENDKLAVLAAHLRSEIQSYLNDNQLQSTIAIPLELPDLTLNGRYRYNTILVVKEALHNIVKHAEASTVSFQLTPTDSHLLITITDNGIGLPADYLTNNTGVGLRSMRNRVQAIGGTIAWSVATPTGTQIHIELPLE